MYTSIKRLQKSGLFKMDSQSVAGEEQSFSHFLSGLVDDSSKKGDLIVDFVHNDVIFCKTSN